MRIGLVEEGLGRTIDIHVLGKSDWDIVSVKRANKGAQPEEGPTTGGVRGEKVLGQGEP